MSNYIPLSVPSLKGKEWEYVKECIDTEWVSSAGKYVDLFEKKVDLEDLNILRNLSELEATKTIIETFKKEINELINVYLEFIQGDYKGKKDSIRIYLLKYYSEWRIKNNAR